MRFWLVCISSMGLEARWASPVLKERHSNSQLTRTGLSTFPESGLWKHAFAMMRQLRMPLEDCQNVSLFGSQCLHRIEA